jgi:hypothetical protein
MSNMVLPQPEPVVLTLVVADMVEEVLVPFDALSLVDEVVPPVPFLRSPAPRTSSHPRSSIGTVRSTSRRIKVPAENARTAEPAATRQGEPPVPRSLVN